MYTEQPEYLEVEQPNWDEFEAEYGDREVLFQTPRIFSPFLKPSRYKGAHGGRGSGKSHFFGDLLIEHCLMNPGTRAICAREVQKSLGQSVKLLLEDKIKKHQVTDQFRVMNHYIRTPGDGIIIFQGMQDHTAHSVKSLEGFDVAWLEEAQSISQRSLDLLRPTLRKEGSEIWATWNPENATDPIDRLLRGDQVIDDAIVVQANFQHNPFLPKVLRREMEWDRARDTEKFEHIWLGGYAKRSHARVFKNWKIDEFETPDDAVFLFGADWGYSIDPAVLVCCWVRQETKQLFIGYEAYEIGVEIDDLPKHFDKVMSGRARKWPILADSNRPDTISYMQRHGYPRLEGAKKGPNSVSEGVIFLQGYDIVVHPRCIHTIDELRLYSFKTDKLTGMVTPHLQDKKNHVIDSLRYAVERLRKPVEEPDWVSW